MMTIPCNCNTAMVTFWVTPLDPTGIAEDKAPMINIFPNPATDFVNIEAEDLLRVTIFDLTGKTVRNVSAEQGRTTIGINDLKSGCYLILVETNRDVVKKAFVKQ